MVLYLSDVTTQFYKWSCSSEEKLDLVGVKVLAADSILNSGLGNSALGMNSLQVTVNGLAVNYDSKEPSVGFTGSLGALVVSFTYC